MVYLSSRHPRFVSFSKSAQTPGFLLQELKICSPELVHVAAVLHNLLLYGFVFISKW